MFSEIADDRVPALAQSDFLEPNKFFGPGAAIGDVDGDGRPDLFVGGVGGGLFLNRADPRGFRFEPAPMPPIDIVPIAIAFGDFDRDGDLDLAVCGHGGTRLFANDGSGGFADVTASAGVAGPPSDLCVSVTFGDLDGDGWPELVAGSYGIVFDATDDEQASHVWINQRDGTFADLPSLQAPDELRRAIITTIGDFDGDGRPDLYLSDDAEVFFLDHTKARHDLVLLNQGLDGDGLPALADASAALGLADERSTMGCLFGDAGDGGWELFLPDIMKGWLMRQSGPGRPFADVAQASGVALGGPIGEE
ncbi:MAG TPA: VCBS repeat-containing protein, partial [Polyangia bacterium]